MSEGSHFSADVRQRAIAAVLEGMPKTHVARAFGVDRTTLFRWMQKYDAEGNVGLLRKTGSGRPRKLEELTEEELRGLVLKGAIHFGFETDLWTVGRLRRVISEEFSMTLSKNTVWRRLRDAGLILQR
jgi:transposase